LLLSRQAPVNTRDYFQEVPLHRACRYGNFKNVRLLLPHYPDPLEYTDTQGRNALHLALLHGRAKTTEAICRHIQTIKHVEDCSARSSKEGTSSPECSCPATYPHLEDEDLHGCTALQLGLNSPRALSALIRFATPNLDVPTRIGAITSTVLFASTPLSWCRPLHAALKVKSMEIIQLLVNGGADVNLPDCIGKTPLMDAVHFKNEEGAKYLLAHGAEYSTWCPKHEDRITILQEAVEGFSLTILEQIDVSNPSNSMSTARGRLLFQEAQRNRRWDIIKTLIEKCPEKEGVGNILDEEFTLKHALSVYDESLVEYLILNGANPNARFGIESDLNSWCAIHYAALGSGVDIANALLKNGADILLEDPYGRRPCQLAIIFNELTTALWFAEETIAKIRKTSKPGEIAGSIESTLDACMSNAYAIGDLEKVDSIFNLGMRELDKDLRKGMLTVAVGCGRVEATKHFLSLGFDLNGTGREGALALEGEFLKIEPHNIRPSNNIADYHECRKLVREAISLQKTRTAGKPSKRKKR
jgi:ankyrin repeat protein